MRYRPSEEEQKAIEAKRKMKQALRDGQQDVDLVGQPPQAGEVRSHVGGEVLFFAPTPPR